MLKFVISKLGSERFSEVLQNQDNAFIRLLWLWFFAGKLLELVGHVVEREGWSFHQSNISERIVMLQSPYRCATRTDNRKSDTAEGSLLLAKMEPGHQIDYKSEDHPDLLLLRSG